MIIICLPYLYMLQVYYDENYELKLPTKTVHQISKNLKFFSLTGGSWHMERHTTKTSILFPTLQVMKIA